MIISRHSYTERAHYCLSPLAKNLFHLMAEKETNLALSADVTSAQKLLDLAELLAPEICVLKTHIDIIEDFTPALTQQLRKLALKHRFMLFEDRKFADIGNTVKHQYNGGIYHIADWADLVNAHSLPGPGIISGLAEVGRKKNRGLILLAEMSSAGHLMGPEYMQNTLKMAEQFSDFVIGFITQHALSRDPHWINITPGVKIGSGSDTLGQQYVTPEKAILENGSDIIIVGRGIIQANDPLTEARKYRQSGWDCYLKRCEK
ncbi:Orotidine 5'-phosphate decarboxylase [Aquicella siphonis]|uniref:Orotidine 5'-phosphate decarboxylase n=2 Tax=Aquicella siphonis TaxID=254247 RepID=A0A5E4PEH2_9COXI|nr:Orotidine 5'-phosphate decarboxylase [Aquicella siphonis]